MSYCFHEMTKCIDKMKDGKEMYEQVLEGKKQVLGAKHTTTLGTIGETAIFTGTKAQ
jgi:hypothetical protein